MSHLPRLLRPAATCGAAAVLLAGTLAGGCAGGTSAPARPAPASAGAAATPSTATCATIAPAGVALTLTDKDNGRTFCVHAGTRVEVLLQGTAAEHWSVVGATGGVLAPAASGKGTLLVGETGGFFDATRTGTAVVDSYRQPCTENAPQAAACDSTHHFRVTVVVA